MTLTINRPTESEHLPYFGRYIQLVPDGEVFDLLAKQVDSLPAVLSRLTPTQADFRFGTAEWSIKEVIGHINDGERIFSYRAVRISRNDQTPLPGFEQNDYVRESNFGSRTLQDLLEEFVLLRRANLLAFERLSPEAFMRCGTASNGPMSVRALLYIMAGHVEHHIESLNINYLANL